MKIGFDIGESTEEQAEPDVGYAESSEHEEESDPYWDTPHAIMYHTVEAIKHTASLFKNNDEAADQ